MVLNLHGGYAGPRPDIAHSTSMYDASSLTNAPATQIIVEPEYQGYADSGGHVEDLRSNTTDAENAVATVEGLGRMSSNLYVIGYSLGGGIALKVASQRSDVKAVVAVSPFMGNDEVIKWLDAHPKLNTPLAQQERTVIPYWESIWGNYKTNPAGYEGVSIIDHISTIHAPVLLLQGTGDQNVIWQLTQDVANQMKQQQKKVKLVLYPGGQHGLHGQYAQQSTQEIISWFRKYGLPTSGYW